MALRKIHATVCYPIYIDGEYEVRDDFDSNNEEHNTELEEMIKNNADKIFESSSIDPIINELILDEDQLI